MTASASSAASTASFLLRSASARFFAPLAFFVGLVQLQANRLWVGEWNMGLQSAVNYAPVAVFAVAAGSALDARAARSTVPDLTASSRTFPPQLWKVLASAAWGYLVLLLLILVVIGANAAVSPWRTPNFAIALAGVTWITLHSALGWLIGWYLPLPIALPMVLLVSWLGSAIPAATPDVGLALLTGIDDGGFPAGLEPRTPIILTQAVVLLALAGAVLLPTIWRRLPTPARTTTALAITASLVTAGLVTSALGPQRRHELTAAAGPKVCRDAPVPSCSFPDHDNRRQAVAELAAQMWAPMKAAGRPTPAGVSEDRLDQPSNWVSVNLWSPDRLSAAIELASTTTSWHLCRSQSTGQPTGDPNEPQVSTALAAGPGAEQRVAWLLVQLDDLALPGRPPQPLVPILNLSMEQQVAWWYERPTDLSCA